jgi:hypothetical protein
MIPALFAFALLLPLCQLGPDREEDRGNIAFLLGVFSLRVRTQLAHPDDLLSPRVTGHERTRAAQFARRQYAQMRFSEFVTHQIEFVDDTHATLVATVEWEADEARVRFRTRLSFEKVSGTWYFENLDFLQTPTRIYELAVVVGLLLAALAGFSWARLRARRSRASSHPDSPSSRTE